MSLKAIIRSRSADGGTVTFRASKTDQQGTVAAVQRYLDGPLFRRIRKGGQVGQERSYHPLADRLGHIPPPVSPNGTLQGRPGRSAG